MMNKYGSTLVIANKNDKDDEIMDRESQQLLLADAADATTTTTANDTNTESPFSVDIVANRKNALYYVSLLLFVTVFAVVGFGSRSSSFFHFFGTHSRSHEMMEISAIATTSVATTTMDSIDETTTTVASSSSTEIIGHDTINKVNKNKDKIAVQEDKQTQKDNYSPFFRVVLPWKQETMADSSEDEGDDKDTTTSSNSSRMSNHYKGVLEFCSDADKGLYGYGLLGECVPGQPSPLIRMKPKTFYQLTVVNNGQVATNIHTHGLHVSGVGTVDDVTRLVEPGNCLTYEVSSFVEKKRNQIQKNSN